MVDPSMDIPEVAISDDDLTEPLRLPKRPPDDSEMDITPMIDITFLLLIFFLVASKMDSDVQIELPPARTGTAVAVKSSAVITITGNADGETQIYKGDGTIPENLVTTGDPEQQEAEIIAYLDQMVSEGKENVLIKAARDVRHREVSRIAAAVGQVEDVTLFVAVLETE